MISKEIKHAPAKKELSRADRVKNIVYHEIVVITVFVLVAGSILGGIIYFEIQSSQIYIEKAEISAPLISLKSEQPGILEKLYVKEGDHVEINAVIAQVGDRSIRTRTSGIITYVNNVPGQLVTSQDTIAQMIDPREFKVVGHLDEDKGLKDVKPGQKVKFTVDAFGSKQYTGIVDLVSPTSRESAIVFSISDKREQRRFDVEAKFDASLYPELKNGMSARMWIYK